MGRQAIRRRTTLRGFWQVAVAMTLALAVGFAGTAGAQNGGALRGPEDRAVIRVQRFAEMMVEAGRLAYVRGTLPAVRDFGAALVRDYQDANIQLLTYAGQTKIDLNLSAVESAEEAELDRSDHRLMQGLRDAPPGEFDYRFAKAMQQLHLRAMTATADARSKVRDENLNQLLEDMLVKMRRHEQFSTNLVNETAPAFRPL